MIEKHIDEILELKKKGFSTSEISKKLNINPSSLQAYYYYHRDVFPKVRKFRRLTNKESESIYNDFFINNMTQKDIAIKYGVCTDTINRHLKKQIQKRGRNNHGI